MRIANSAGVLVEDVQPLFSIRVSVIAREKRRAARGHRPAAAAASGPSSSRRSRPSTSPARRRAWPSTLLGAVEAPAGPMPVVLGPGWPGILLHEAVGHGLEGDFNRKGTLGLLGPHRRARGRARA